LDKSEQMKALSEMKQKLLAIEKQIKAKGVKCKSEVDLDVDNVFKDISEVIAKREDVNLIVMGSKGSSGLTEILVGSNTERVVRYAKSPVLTVKLINDNFKIDKIVYSTDFEETSIEVFQQVIKIINVFEAHLCLLYVNTPNYFISNTDINIRFDEFIKKHKLSNFSTHIYSDLSEEKGILNFSKEMNADLIVMPTNGRTGFAHLINGSITEDVVNHATIPVLSINMGKCK
jgi:nucleotide-binding universal stress UspA family protein